MFWFALFSSSNCTSVLLTFLSVFDRYYLCTFTLSLAMQLALEANKKTPIFIAHGLICYVLVEYKSVRWYQYSGYKDMNIRGARIEISGVWGYEYPVWISGVRGNIFIILYPEYAYPCTTDIHILVPRIFIPSYPEYSGTKVGIFVIR